MFNNVIENETTQRVHCPPGGPLFERADAAAYLEISSRTLELYASGCMGEDAGPPYRIIGRRARYLKADLDHWILSRPAITSRRKIKTLKA